MVDQAFKDLVEKRCNQRIHPRAWDIQPSGSRLLVVLDPTTEKYKGIVIPEVARELTKGGGGWVIGVGPLVGRPGVQYPGAPVLATPEELLGAHILFGKHVGQVITFSFLDRDYKGIVILLTDRDIWAVDSNPEAAAAELREG